MQGRPHSGGLHTAQLIVPHVTLAQKMLPGPKHVLERCIGLPDPPAQQCRRFRTFDKVYKDHNVQFQFRGFDDTREYRNFFRGPGSIGTVFHDPGGQPRDPCALVQPTSVVGRPSYLRASLSFWCVCYPNLYVTSPHISLPLVSLGVFLSAFHWTTKGIVALIFH
jgi:hypothetical protein